MVCGVYLRPKDTRRSKLRMVLINISLAGFEGCIYQVLRHLGETLTV